MINKEVKRARVIAIVIGTLSCVALIAMVFGYVQLEVAKANELRAEQNALLAKQNQERALQQELQAKQVQIQTAQQLSACQSTNEALEQELIKLRNGRKK